MEEFDAGAHYRAAFETVEREQQRQRKRDRFFVSAKLALFLLLVTASLWIVRYHPRQAYVLLTLLVVLGAVFVLHERALARLRQCRRLQRYYVQALARLEDRWAGTGSTGERFLTAEHPNARDLDLFGAGGLFELLSVARTRAGEETLAAWLLSPASTETVGKRQGAVRELAPRWRFREAMALAGDEVRVGGHPQELLAWCEGHDSVPKVFTQVAAPTLALAWIGSLALWAVTGSPDVAIGLTFLNYCVNWILGKKADAAADAVEASARDLGLLAAVFRLFEQEGFESAHLRELQAGFHSGSLRASDAVRKLDRRMQWLESRHNILVRLIQPFVFWSTLWMGAVHRWREAYGDKVAAWLTAAGEIEALNSLACHVWEHPENVFPALMAGRPRFEAQALVHPLLPRKRAVANDIRLGEGLQLIVLSGPNMAGKSTLLRAIGLNAVLAQAGGAVCAASLTMSSLAVAASICVLDSLQGGLSRFYAEIQRLKQMQDIADGELGTLFLLDELLSGTNSNDRRVGSEAVVRNLLIHGAIGLVTTHDLALTEIVERLDGRAANFHFHDRFEDGRLTFDYRMVPGVVQTANALQLMRSVGLRV